MSFSHSAVLAVKRAFYGSRGEPFRIAGHTLRFVPGTRPTRLRYARSPNRVNRFDALQAELLSKSLHPGDLALDVGGNVGGVALIMAACVGSAGRVVTFEPDPASRATMGRNFGLNPAVTWAKIEPFAVSDQAGVASFFSDGANSSLRKSVTAHPETATAVTVAMVTLDGYLTPADVPAWVKIDIEGAEIAALRGARRLLSGPTNFVVELHPYAWSAFGAAFDDLKQVVSAAGRRMRYLDETHELSGEPVYGTVVLERI